MYWFPGSAWEPHALQAPPAEFALLTVDGSEQSLEK